MMTWKETTAFEQIKIQLFQDNTSVHTSAVSMAKICQLDYELLPHPTKVTIYKPEEIGPKNTNFDDLGKSKFLEGIQKFKKRGRKCIMFKGVYVEKLN